MKFVPIEGGDRVPPSIPDKVVEVPLVGYKPVPHVRVKPVRKGDAEWDDAVEAWMFVQGFIKEQFTGF